MGRAHSIFKGPLLPHIPFLFFFLLSFLFSLQASARSTHCINLIIFGPPFYPHHRSSYLSFIQLSLSSIMFLSCLHVSSSQSSSCSTSLQPPLAPLNPHYPSSSSSYLVSLFHRPVEILEVSSVLMFKPFFFCCFCCCCLSSSSLLATKKLCICLLG